MNPILTYGQLAGLLHLDEREAALDRLLTESANRYVRDLIGKDYESGTEIPAPVQDAVLTAFCDRKVFYRNVESGKKEDSPSAAAGEIARLIEPYRVKTL